MENGKFKLNSKAFEIPKSDCEGLRDAQKNTTRVPELPGSAAMPQRCVPLTGKTLSNQQIAKDVNSQLIGMLMIVQAASNRFSFCRMYMNRGIITVCLSDEIVKGFQIDPTMTMDKAVKATNGKISAKVLLFISTLMSCREEFPFSVTTDSALLNWPGSATVCAMDGRK